MKLKILKQLMVIMKQKKVNMIIGYLLLIPFLYTNAIIKNAKLKNILKKLKMI